MEVHRYFDRTGHWGLRIHILLNTCKGRHVEFFQNFVNTSLTAPKPGFYPKYQHSALQLCALDHPLSISINSGHRVLRDTACNEQGVHSFSLKVQSSKERFLVLLYSFSSFKWVPIFTLMCTACLTEYLQDAFLEVEFQVVGLEFALTYERIFSDCCMEKIWNLASKTCNFLYEY